MARDSGGTYTPPAGQPVVTGTTISSATFNTLVDDLGDELTDSLSRSGKGGMTAALRGPNGTASAPTFAFTNDTGVGVYRSASGEASLTAGGAAVAKWTAAGFFASLLQSLTAVSLRLLGRAATSGSAVGVIIDTDSTYVSGDKILSIRSNTSEKASVDYAGNIVTSGTVTGADSTSTATVGTNWDIGAGTGSHDLRKNGTTVTLTFQAIATGAGAATILTLPVGYRPSTTLYGYFGSLTDNSAGLVYPVVMQVQSGGGVVIDYYDNGTSLVVTGTAPLSNIAVSDAIRATIAFVI